MGRKQTNAAHQYFIHNKSTNKSKCIVPGCTTHITGNHATNLAYHLSSKHQEIFKIVQKRNESIAERDKNNSQLQKSVPSLENNPIENSYDDDEEKEESVILSPKKCFLYKNKLQNTQTRISVKPKAIRIMRMKRNNNIEGKVDKVVKVDDEFYYFALSVAAQLRKLPIDVAMNIQTKIQSALSLARVTSTYESQKHKNPLPERIEDSSEDMSEDEIEQCVKEENTQS